MTSLIYHVLAWQTLFIALLVFGFAPGAALRLIVLAYQREDPRRKELLSELSHVPRIERPFWVAEQLETALSDGLRGRVIAWRAKRSIPALVTTVPAVVLMRDPERGVDELVVSLPAELKHADVSLDELWRGISQALLGHRHMVRCGNIRSQSAAELEPEWALFQLSHQYGVPGQPQNCLGCGARLEDHPKSQCWLWLQWL